MPREFINAPAIRTANGLVVQPFIQWNDALEIYEPMVLVYDEHRDHYPKITSKPFKQMLIVNKYTPELRSVCSTQFGAMHMAMASAYHYAEQHSGDMC